MLQLECFIYTFNDLFFKNLEKNLKEEFPENKYVQTTNEEDFKEFKNNNFLIVDYASNLNLASLFKFIEENKKLRNSLLFFIDDLAQKQELLSKGLLERDIILKATRRKNEITNTLHNKLKLAIKEKEVIQYQAMEKVFSKYFPEEFKHQITEQEDTNFFQGKNREVCIMFFDIRKSTIIAHELEPKEFAGFLSEIFTDIMDLIFGNQGSVLRMLGDGLMCTFGFPEKTEQDCRNAIKCALDLVQYMKDFNAYLPEYLSSPIGYGIGIAAGEIFTGTIGSVRRMEHMILGKTVNLAAHMEKATKKIKPVKILFDENTYQKIIEAPRLYSQYKIEKTTLSALGEPLRDQDDDANAYYFVAN